MYTPHVITVYNTWEDDNLLQQYNITILRGVFLDVSKGANVSKSGLNDADAAICYIPFNVEALSTNGTAKSYVKPKEFDSLADKTNYWTMNPGGSSSSTATYFVKGEVTTAYSLSALKGLYDFVYDVTNVDLRDFGSVSMRHWQVGGK